MVKFVLDILRGIVIGVANIIPGVSGGTITLEKTGRFVPVHDRIGVAFSYHDLQLSGSGTRYDNMIVFGLVYEGDYSESSFEGTVTASRINCIATQNE